MCAGPVHAPYTSPYIAHKHQNTIEVITRCDCLCNHLSTTGETDRAVAIAEFLGLSNFRHSVVLQNTGQWTKYKTSVNRNVIHQCQNHLESIWVRVVSTHNALQLLIIMQTSGYPSSPPYRVSSLTCTRGHKKIALMTPTPKCKSTLKLRVCLSLGLYLYIIWLWNFIKKYFRCSC
jgi:hypothetical protein